MGRRPSTAPGAGGGWFRLRFRTRFVPHAPTQRTVTSVSRRRASPPTLPRGPSASFPPPQGVLTEAGGTKPLAEGKGFAAVGATSPGTNTVKPKYGGLAERAGCARRAPRVEETT